MADCVDQPSCRLSAVSPLCSGDFSEFFKVCREFTSLVLKAPQAQVNLRFKRRVNELCKSAVKRACVAQDFSEQHSIGIVKHVKARHEGLRLRHFQQSHHFGKFLSLLIIKIIGAALVVDQRLAETLNPSSSPNEFASKKLQDYDLLTPTVLLLQPVILFGNVKRSLACILGCNSKEIRDDAKTNCGEHANKGNRCGPAIPHGYTLVTQPPTLAQGLPELHLFHSPDWKLHFDMSLIDGEATNG